jgi:hypothetical protein
MTTTRRFRTARRALPVVAAALVLTTCAPTLATIPAARLAGAPGAEERLAQRLELSADRLVSVSRPVEAPLPAPERMAPTAGEDVVSPEVPPPPAAPAPAPAPSQIFEPVAVQAPKIRLDRVPADRDVVAQVLDVEGVSFATAVTLAETSVAGAGGPETVRVAGVDPQAFRVFTPQVTADAVAVWERVTEGDAAFTHDVGNRLQLTLGARIPAGEAGLRVGALASNGVPPIADVIVSEDTADELDLEGDRSVLIAVGADESADRVAQRIEAATGLRAEVLADPRPRRAFLTGNAARKAFEAYTYIDNGDGMIQIDPGWVRRNIVSARVPIFTGNVVCHRLMVDQLRGALQEIVDRGLDHLIDPTQYGGCWVPRHIDFNPAKPLSMHSWGLAVDFNVSTNGLGQVPQMDPRIVEVFDRWGFVWGGRWRRPDGMHFELGALLQSTQG